MTSKKTPLYDKHVELGGRMVEFGGWMMPVQYSSISEEHMHVREHVGLFDVSHMGEVDVAGKDSLKFLQWLLPRDLSELKVGQAEYTPMCYENGTIVDDLLVYKLAENRFMLVVNASNIDKDFGWIKKNAADFDVVIKNDSDNTAQLAVQGPKAIERLQSICDINLDDIKHFNFQYGKIAGVDCLISRTGYTGEDGVEIYFRKDDAIRLWKSIICLDSVRPIGLGARDTLRLECCMMLYGNDIDDTTTPIEARLRWTVCFDKDFIGKNALVSQRDNGVQKRLCAFELVGKGIPRHGQEICDKGGKTIGHVTSGTFSPFFKKGIGMGYVPVEISKDGNIISIRIRDSLVEAKTVKMPFYKRG
ncbi:glycine cleavage system protein T [Candidatus Woesearchaeota archaeon CG11_big_fil_rev_8_21_14_0_20_43_8]|nr:MAG: glycine cleavage system protein T [Candidatus Woesearchaeota archaeon CG11_big_fil_rev_8_21_14_0_20_43_8]PIO06791.1 MAG: glycine cleavage system protein T [Candidatus Woesearchaeota archaeon CG08_land_8_20_14_0_20_43_7]